MEFTTVPTEEPIPFTIGKGKTIAIHAHSPELEVWHIYTALLMETNNFLRRMSDGSAKLETEMNRKRQSQVTADVIEISSEFTMKGDI